MIAKTLIAVGLALALGAAPALADRTPAPPGAKATILSPADGAAVSNPVTVVFGLEGMGVAPAGVDKQNTFLLYPSPCPRARTRARMPSSA